MKFGQFKLQLNIRVLKISNSSEENLIVQKRGCVYLILKKILQVILPQLILNVVTISASANNIKFVNFHIMHLIK